MIPKKIHYCWFGPNDIPESVKDYIKSWKKYLPDYELILWNEESFDINSNTYTKEAYDAKKYAFVTDYVRLYAMYHEGGIYMDTDVEVCQNMDQLLSLKAFSGFESYTDVPTGIMACEKNFKLFGELLSYYDDKHFIKEDGTLDLTTNVEIITKELEKRGLQKNNTYQVIDGFTLYPKEIFCPDLLGFGEKYSNDVITIHHFAGSWLPDEIKMQRESFIYKLKLKLKLTCRYWIISLIGKKNFDNLRGRKS